MYYIWGNKHNDKNSKLVWDDIVDDDDVAQEKIAVVEVGAFFEYILNIGNLALELLIFFHPYKILLTHFVTHYLECFTSGKENAFSFCV